MCPGAYATGATADSQFVAARVGPLAEGKDRTGLIQSPGTTYAYMLRQHDDVLIEVDRGVLAKHVGPRSLDGCF